MIIILVIFDIGYLFRFVYDIEFADNLDQFPTDVMFLFLSIFCDFMPISVLILFHYRNFREKPAEQEDNFQLGGETIVATGKNYSNDVSMSEEVVTMQLVGSFSENRSP